MTTETGLTKEQKWSVFLLSIGTFLEYFDLYLYVHMSMLLNDLFFPKTNPTTAQLLGATAFCLTYLLRPVAGLIIGKIGDIKGRKYTITITTFVMAIACLIMASTPGYEEIGITATIMVIVSRMLQGFSSLGEMMGAFLYLSEILKVPHKCVAAGIAGVATHGGLFALSIASFVLFMGINWRWAFVAGAFIAIIGIFARLKLRETPEFTNHKLRIAKKMEKNNQDPKSYESFDNEKVNKKTVLAFFLTELHNPICGYITYIYLANFMKESLNMTYEQVINHNLKIAILALIGALIVACLAKKVHPIKIAIISGLLFVVTLPFIPYWLNNLSDSFSLFCLQCVLIPVGVSTCGTLDAVQYKYFPIGKRFFL